MRKQKIIIILDSCSSFCIRKRVVIRSSREATGGIKKNIEENFSVGFTVCKIGKKI